jgi:ABC-type glutathione transport system ATPase component
VSLNASWRLYDGGRTDARSVELEAQLRAATGDRDELERRIRLDVEIARTALQSALAETAAADAAQRAAAARLEAELERFEAGLAITSDVLEAQAQLADAERQQIAARARSQIARCNSESCGGPMTGTDKNRDPVVRVQHLTRTFGVFRAVDDVSFSVTAGEVFGFLGSNGAGKTTTIRMLCGLLLPSSGEASVAGCDITRDAKALRRRIGYMSQRFSLYRDLTVAENLRFWGGAYGLFGDRLAHRRQWALEMAELDHQRDELVRDLPEVTGNVWPWAAPCCTNPRWCSWTNQPAASIPRLAACSGT